MRTRAVFAVLASLAMSAVLAFPVAAEEAPPARKFQNEQAWVMSELIRDITGLLGYAHDRTAPQTVWEITLSQPEAGAAAVGTVKNASGSVSVSLPLKHHLWAPEVYAPLVEKLLADWQIKKPADSRKTDNEVLVELLTKATQRELISEGKRLSHQLSENPLEPKLHEEAALLYGSLGLREAAGPFADPRTTLSRMTAHLAIARALQEKPGLCGRLADTILLALVNRQAEALEQIASLPPEMKPWTTALRLRCTGDWRILSDPLKATPLERREEARALVYNHTNTGLIDFLKKIEASLDPEWTRQVMDRGVMSVGESHIFAKDFMQGEMKDAVEDLYTFFPRKQSAESFMMMINDTPDPVVVKTTDGKQAVEVLGWGHWAAFHQRLICLGMIRTSQYLRMLGVPDTLKNVDEQLERSFATLRLYPLALRWRAHTKEQYETAMRKSTEICAREPQWVTPALWHELRVSSDLGKAPAPIPPFPSWFNPKVPFGTAMDLSGRFRDSNGRSVFSGAGRSEVKALAPHDYFAAGLELFKNRTAMPKVEEAEKAFASMVDYSLPALLEISKIAKDNVEVSKKYLTKACELDPSRYVKLGKYLLDHHQEAEAAVAYQAAFDKASDRVHISVVCGWLVNYYFDHGRKEDALKIAKDAAEAYSFMGLRTLAELYERMENYREALLFFGRGSDRYNNNKELLLFLKRRKDSTKDLAADLDKITRQMFPEGMEKAGLKDFKGRPKDGVTIAASSDASVIAGLHKGDIIVALDGYRVHSTPQYYWVRDLSTDPNMTIIVWNGTEYQEIKINAPKRTLDYQLETNGEL